MNTNFLSEFVITPLTDNHKEMQIIRYRQYKKLPTTKQNCSLNRSLFLLHE